MIIEEEVEVALSSDLEPEVRCEDRGQFVFRAFGRRIPFTRGGGCRRRARWLLYVQCWSGEQGTLMLCTKHRKRTEGYPLSCAEHSTRMAVIRLERL